MLDQFSSQRFLMGKDIYFLANEIGDGIIIPSLTKGIITFPSGLRGNGQNASQDVGHHDQGQYTT